MFRRLFKSPKAMPRDLQEELASMCHSIQIDHLALSKRERADIGLDCGCVPDRRYLGLGRL